MKKMKNKIIILCLALFITYQSANQIQASPIWNLESGINLINMQKYDEAAKFFEGYTKKQS